MSIKNLSIGVITRKIISFTSEMKRGYAKLFRCNMQYSIQNVDITDKTMMIFTFLNLQTFSKLRTKYMLDII